MSGTREKFNAVFLAAVMVLSMVAFSTAFAGSAAALSDDGSSDITTDVTTAGVQANHTLTVGVESGDSIEGSQLDNITVDYSNFGTIDTDTLSNVITNDDGSVSVAGASENVDSVVQDTAVGNDESAVINVSTSPTISDGDSVQVDLTNVITLRALSLTLRSM